MILCYAEPEKGYSKKLCRAFAQGCGGTMDVSTQYKGGPAFVSGLGDWQKSIIQQAGAAAWWQADHGYFGRGQFYRITRRKLWHDGRGEPDYMRLGRHALTFEPARKTGTDVLFVGQSDGFYRRWTDHPLEAYISALRAVVRGVSDRKIIVRRKPIHGHTEPPLDEHLAKAWIVITHSSAIALQALARGIPVVVGDPTYPAARLATEIENIESPRFPDPDEVRNLFAVLAAQQWTIAECAHGVAWSALKGR